MDGTCARYEREEKYIPDIDRKTEGNRCIYKDNIKIDLMKSKCLELNLIILSYGLLRCVRLFKIDV
jgi:hypothetical protein